MTMTSKEPVEEIVVLITCPNEDEAVKIAGAVVEEKLAACVNIIKNIRSIYKWEGKLQDDTEVLMIAKTHKDRFDGLQKRVKELHSYDVPEIISLSITDGSEDYLSWIRRSTEK